MKKSVIGEIGELSVFMELLKKGYEAYRANSKIQKGWDIVVINKNTVKRIQVKTTILKNKSTNNTFKVNNGYDIMVVVVIDDKNRCEYNILTKKEVSKILRANNNKQLSISKTKKGIRKIKDEISAQKNKWNKI